MKKRLMQQFQSQGEAARLQNEKAQAEEAIKRIIMTIMDEKARERMNNLRITRPEIYINLGLYLAQLAQSGQLQSRITDEQLVQILRKVSEKKDTKITRK